MERITAKQKEVFDELLEYKEDFNMSTIGKKLCISRQAVANRLKFMVLKGYVKQEEGVYRTTGEGLDKIIKTGGKTKHTYYDTTANWEKTLSADGFSKAVKARDEQEQDRVGDSPVGTPATP